MTTQSDKLISHYVADEGAAYFQRRASSRSPEIQRLRAQIFQDLNTEHATVLDFGCGSGGILSEIYASRKIGIEIGAEARDEAERRGIEVKTDLSTIADDSIDYVISFHALEHVDDPVGIMRQIHRVLKPAGVLRVVVPYEHIAQSEHRRWQPNFDHHLFAWTPLTLGNLILQAGFKSIDSKVALAPTGSRLVKVLRKIGPLARIAHFIASYRTKSFNVIANAIK